MGRRPQGIRAQVMNRSAPSRHLLIIRIALMTGVATFAGIVAWQRANGNMLAQRVGSELPMDGLRIALWALAVVAVMSALWLRTRIGGARGASASPTSPASPASMTIIGWSFGEGVALFGIMQHYLGAPLTTMAVGLLTFVVVLITLPVPRAAF